MKSGIILKEYTWKRYIFISYFILITFVLSLLNTFFFFHPYLYLLCNSNYFIYIMYMYIEILYAKYSRAN